jgi:hypothetical protein
VRKIAEERLLELYNGRNQLYNNHERWKHQLPLLLGVGLEVLNALEHIKILVL